VPKANNSKSSISRFRSRSEHALDSKGRLNIPSRFRDVLHGHYHEQLMVTNWHKCLKAFPAKVWEQFETTLLVQGKKQPGMESFRRYVISGVADCPAWEKERKLTRDKFSDFEQSLSALGIL
jgi:MraZ protein